MADHHGITVVISPLLCKDIAIPLYTSLTTPFLHSSDEESSRRATRLRRQSAHAQFRELNGRASGSKSTAGRCMDSLLMRHPCPADRERSRFGTSPSASALSHTRGLVFPTFSEQLEEGRDAKGVAAVGN